MARNLFILLPQYKQTCPLTLFSLLGLFDRSTMQCSMQYGDAYIVHARNKLADTFMQSEAEWALWIDDDMVLPFGNPSWFKAVTEQPRLSDARAGYHTVNRLMSHGKTLVGGLYFGRTSKRIPMFAPVPGVPPEDLHSGRDFGLLQTRWVATGCLLTHRSVFSDIQKTHPHLGPRGSEKYWQYFSPSEDQAVSNISEARKQIEAGDFAQADSLLRHAEHAVREHSLATGEDVAFCLRAARAGHAAHVDTSLVCGHVGQHVYGVA